MGQLIGTVTLTNGSSTAHSIAGTDFSAAKTARDAAQPVNLLPAEIIGGTAIAVDTITYNAGTDVYTLGLAATWSRPTGDYSVALHLDFDEIGQAILSASDAPQTVRPNINRNFGLLKDRAGVGGTASARWLTPSIALHPEDFGAVADARTVRVNVSGTTATATSGLFSPADAGKSILINPGSASHQLRTISAYVSSTQVTLNASATGVSNKRAVVGTDNTAAFQAAISGVFNNKGGDIRLGAGQYLIAGALQDPSGNNSVLLLPDPAYNGLLYKFSGVIPAPNLYNDYATDAALDWPGTVIYVATQGAGTQPAFMRPQRTSGMISGGLFTHASVQFENILFRQPVDPPIHCLDFGYGGGLELQGCSFDVDFDDYHLFPVPINQAAAVIFPGNGNSSWCQMRRGCVLGYYFGVKSFEHTSLAEVNLFNNARGLFIGEGIGTTLYKVHFNENLHQIHVDETASYPRLNAFGVEFENPLAVGGNNNFNPTHVIYENRVGSGPILDGQIVGTLSNPGQSTSAFDSNFASPFLSVHLSQLSDAAIVKTRRLTPSADPTAFAELAIGDATADGGMPFSAVGAKIGHATSNGAVAFTKGGGNGAVVVYVLGQNKLYLCSLVGGAFGAGVIVIQSDAGGRLVIGNNDDGSSKVCIDGDVLVKRASDSGGKVVIGDGSVEKVPGSGFVAGSGLKCTAGDVEAAAVGSGFILKSADGSRWRIGVSNAGILSAAAA